jgi:biopolymer transport protein ExbB/TolQ
MLARRNPQLRRTGPTDPTLGLTGAAAALLTVLFYGAVVYPLSDTYLGQLFGARGSVPYGISFLSLWAAVVLALKYRSLLRQREALALDLLPRAVAERITPGDVPALVARLDALPGGAGRSLLAQRVRRALQHFEARRDAREVMDQLGSQAQSDADAVESSYSMVQVFIWAVPILGFIGTVLGIGAAVGGFSSSVGAAADLSLMKSSIGTVTTGLALAFDTTLLALVMSILIMFPASTLRKAEEDFLTDVEDYCDEHLVRRLDDGGRAEAADSARVDHAVREAVAHEMAGHHAELRSWLERLGQVGETITAHVVSGWEKIDEMTRLRQDRQMDHLAQWAAARQREAVEELAETQRALLRDFRASLEGMAAEARRVQEEGVHRADDQLAAVERLHRRLQEDQVGAAEAHRSQVQALASAGDQLTHTLARLRAEAAEVRDESARRLGDASAQLRELGRSVQDFQRGLVEAEESNARSLRDSADRLADTLAGVDEQLRRFQDASTGHLAAASAQLDELGRARADAHRRDAELREAQTAALAESSRRIAEALDALRAEAASARGRLAEALAGVAPELASRVESLADDFAEPWRRQLAHLERLHERLEVASRAAARRAGNSSRLGRLFRRS